MLHGNSANRTTLVVRCPIPSSRTNHTVGTDRVSVLARPAPTAPFRWSSSNAHDHTSQGRTREAIPPGTVLPIPALSLAHSEVEPSNWRPRAWRLLPASSGSGPTLNNTHNSQLSFVSSAYLR